jgi:hypothetical protein
VTYCTFQQHQRQHTDDTSHTHTHNPKDLVASSSIVISHLPHCHRARKSEQQKLQLDGERFGQDFFSHTHMFFITPKFRLVVASVMMLASLRQRGMVAAFSTTGGSCFAATGGVKSRALSSGTRQRFSVVPPAWPQNHPPVCCIRTPALWMSTSTPEASTQTSSGVIPRVKASEATEPSDGPVLVKGWVRTVRKQKTLAFVEVNDGSNMAGLQCVLNFDDIDEDTKKGGFRLAFSSFCLGRSCERPHQLSPHCVLFRRT